MSEFATALRRAGIVGQPPPPRPEPGQGAFPASPGQTKCRAQNVQLSGGALNNILTDPTVRPFEYLFRRLPEQGIHSATVSRQAPYIVELGSYQVPKDQALAIFDFRPDIYRFSGIDPNDAIPFESRRFGSQIGYDLTVNNNRPAQLKFELEPIGRQEGTEYSTDAGNDVLRNPGFLPSNASFEQARANSFGDASGAGTGLLPQRHERYGAPVLPLSIVVQQDQSIAFKAVVFKRITSPIAFFEMGMAGIQVPINMLDELMTCFNWRQQ